ncbi:MAG: hypothetical protein ACYTFT_07165, partial [Planctomycetota bacterium]
EAAKSLAAADTAARKRLVASLIRQNDVGALLLHLPQETDGAVLADLINYLGGLGSEEARISIQAKASQLEPKQHAAQRAALEVLDRLANPESIPALADIAVITTSPEIKDRATKALSDRQQGLSFAEQIEIQQKLAAEGDERSRKKMSLVGEAEARTRMGNAERRTFWFRVFQITSIVMVILFFTIRTIARRKAAEENRQRREAAERKRQAQGGY